ncbi:MAG: response regulator [Treponema sp.]|nr:response regulator [Treponema sp.]
MYKIVVIEDEPNVRKELVLCFPWQATGVLFSGEAGDGKQGKELIQNVHPDIVITDIRMPGMDGIEMIHEIKQAIDASGDSWSEEPEWIIISGYNEFEYARQAMQMGVQEYLLKPVEDQQLEEALQRCKERIDKKRHIKRITTAATKENSASIKFFTEYQGALSDGEDYVSQTVSIIRSRYVQGITIESVAEELGISSGHLSRLFKKETGYTFTDYLMYERISVAAQLLRDTDKKIYEIADLVGYEDVRYFGQLFKRVTGFTPKEFKNN